ncbi:MAG: hypothetical protein ACLR23_07650 [Clostridia bacterium]
MIYAGIDLGGTSIKGALVTDKGEILRKKSDSAGAERSHREVVTDMANLILGPYDGGRLDAGGGGVGGSAHRAP